MKTLTQRFWLSLLLAGAGFVFRLAADDPPAQAKPPGVAESVAGEAAKRRSDDNRARKIAVHDILSISVANEPEFLKPEMRVDEDGTISLPYLGSLKVAGMTRSEAEQDIRERLDRDWIINPQVTVDFKSYDTAYVTVTGAVLRPGQVPIPPDHRMDMMEAIGAAGDLVREADKSDIQLRRKNQITHHKYKELFQSPVYLETGDVIFVGKTIL